MKHGNKKGKAKAKATPSGKKSKTATKSKASPGGSAKKIAAKSALRQASKTDGKGRGRNGDAVTFNNPVVAAAFKRAVKKYPNAFRRLTD
jgi:hypothetical protein